ncbi:MAG: GxxExxY protein [Planctomycetota bacterium]
MEPRMNTNKHEIIYKDLSYQIIKASFEVHNILGAGFLEKVYENALIIKLRQYGIKAEQQVPAKVCFEGETVGEYYADIVVDNKIILELKCVELITPIHEAQLINYLKATGMKLGMILNFARPKFEYRRIVL